ncbi:MAG: hypothetical protein Q8Q95_00845 [bacterium]|nr:hypothetical protein [bacterium]
MDETTNNSNGENNRWAWIVTGVVVLVAIIGFYSWPQSTSDETAEVPANNVVEEDIYTASLNNFGSSDELADIENDLNNTDVSNLDKETADVDSAINNE